MGQTKVEIQVEDSGGLTDRPGFDVTVSGTQVMVSVSGNRFCAGRGTGVKRCYEVDPGAAMDATVRFYFSEEERNGRSPEDLLVFHYATGEWVEEPGPYTRGGAGDGQYVEAENMAASWRFALDGPSDGLVYLPMVMKP